MLPHAQDLDDDLAEAADEVKAKIRETLAGQLDEYAIEAGDDDLAEAVAAFCLSSELCEEEDDAEAKAQELLEALGRGASKPVEAPKPPSPKIKPRAPSAALAAAKSRGLADAAHPDRVG